MKPIALPRRLRPRCAGQRDLLTIEIREASELVSVVVPNTKYFVSLIAWDSTEVSAPEMRRVARLLLDAGCVYFCCWGEGCERVHDAIDEEYAARGTSVNDEESTIMTTWHSGESLEEAAWFTANAAYPDDRFIDECQCVLAVSVGSQSLALLVAKALLAAHGAA